MSVSTTPIDMKPICTRTTGIASAMVARNSESGAPVRSLPLSTMRISVLVTVATLALARDSVRAQSAATYASPSLYLMAQAIPLVTRADPTATRSALTEGYLTQPIVMAHALWGDVRGVGTFNLEGLTLQRGELNTGGYGEGFVDRRHPHAYVHELLAGAEHGDATGRFDMSLFAGRGFAPFGSDDPMMRPFEKYPVNHHLAQILERVVAVGAVRYGPLIGEVGVVQRRRADSVPARRRIGRASATRGRRVSPFSRSSAEK